MFLYSFNIDWSSLFLGQLEIQKLKTVDPTWKLCKINDLIAGSHDVIFSLFSNTKGGSFGRPVLHCKFHYHSFNGGGRGVTLCGANAVLCYYR